MKRLTAMFLVGMMLVMLTACSSGGGNVTTQEGKTGDAGGKKYRVGFILSTSINDGGWGTACYSDLAAACEKRPGWELAYTDSLPQDGYYDAMVAYCNEGFELIYAPGGEYTDAVLQVAAEYPNVSFALLNGSEDTPKEAVNGNVSCLLPDAQQIGWIAGALAGLMSETGTIAFIGGMELTTTLSKYEGYLEAAAFVAEKEGKTVKSLDPVYANSFDDSSKGIEFANAMIQQGADVFFGDASAVDSGARQAIDEHNKAAGSVKVYDIAQPADFLGQNECIIGSQVTDNSNMIVLSFKAVEEGSFGGEVLYGNLQNGVLSAGKLSELVPSQLQDKYHAYINQMVEGSFMK